MGNSVGAIRMIVQGRFVSSIEVHGHENNNAHMENSEARWLVEKTFLGGILYKHTCGTFRIDSSDAYAHREFNPR